MALTPEGKVKAKVSKVLDWYGAYRFMPVQNGMGTPGLDYHCVAKGFAFFIETKAKGKNLTARQNVLKQRLEHIHCCPVFVIDDTTPAALFALIRFLDSKINPNEDRYLKCIAECWSDKELKAYRELEVITS